MEKYQLATRSGSLSNSKREAVEKVCQCHSRAFVVLTNNEYAPRTKAPAALPVEGRVLARLGWAGQTTAFVNYPLAISLNQSFLAL